MQYCLNEFRRCPPKAEGAYGKPVAKMSRTDSGANIRSASWPSLQQLIS